MALVVTTDYIYTPDTGLGADQNFFILDNRGTRAGSSSASAFYVERSASYPYGYSGGVIQGGTGSTSCGAAGVRINYPLAFQYRTVSLSVQYYDYYTNWDGFITDPPQPTPTMCGGNFDASGFQLYQAVNVGNGVGNVPSTFGYCWIAFGV